MKAQIAISTLMRQWRLRFWIKILTSIVLIGLILFPWLNEFWPLLFFISASLVIVFNYRKKPVRAHLISLLNAQFPKLEYSAHLFEASNATGLAALQQKKVEKQLDDVVRSFKYPVKWSVLPIGVIAVGISFLLAFMPNDTGVLSERQPDLVKQEQISAEEREPIVIKLESLEAIIEPPGYTNLKAFDSKHDIRMPEGSRVTWSFNFTEIPKHAFLHFSNGDSLSIVWQNRLQSIRRSDLDQGFYWASYFDGTTDQRTPYYKIELVPDEPPVVEISGIAQYQELSFSPDASLTFQVKVLDDYGLSDASIVATVTKGDGESVKFREERLTFNSPISGKEFSESMTLKAKDFDMEPGNELYFYLEATDNKTPGPQFNRTETFFFVLEDTTDVEFSLVGSLGVDLMPEYFRSQRQIIIDTEKLLAEKSEISEMEFKTRSNELGFDQKTLRLKYGQFLGEEAESGIAIENEIEEGHEDHDHEEEEHKPGENVLEEFGHDHDHEDEEGQLMDKGTEQKTEAEKAIEEIAHSHDDAETATFYEVSLKTKLRTALSEMWDSELYLRLYEPEKSLPYQYAALKLLKEIKNHARIYVQRIGFDPPPITEEGKRLTGDLDEIDTQKFSATRLDSISFPGIRAAIFQFGSLGLTKDSVDNSIQKVLKLAGNELAAEAIKFPSRYLEELGTISRLMKMDVFDREALEEIAQLRGVLLSVLKQEETVPLSVKTSSHPLAERVREKLSMQSSRR